MLTLNNLKSQSQRSENAQNRPTSSYGAQPGQGGGAAPGSSASAAYGGGDDSVNHIISPHGIDPSQPDAAYGGVYPPGNTNNGVGHEPY